MAKRKIEFKTPRQFTKTHDFGAPVAPVNYPLTEDWQVALDDLCDLFIKTKKARAFLEGWLSTQNLSPRDESVSECKTIAARRVDYALCKLRQAGVHLEAAWSMCQDCAYDVYKAQKNDASANNGISPEKG